VLIAGPHGFERTVVFALDDDPAVIAERVRETVEDQAARSLQREAVASDTALTSITRSTILMARIAKTDRKRHQYAFDPHRKSHALTGS
jgi:hypothetical protein